MCLVVKMSPRLICPKSIKQRIIMQNRPMQARLAVASECLLRRPEEPPAELRPPVCILHLLVILQVIPDEEVRPLTLPQTTPNPLLCATAQYSELMPISHHDDNIRPGVNLKTLHSKLADYVLVAAKLVRNIPKLLRRKLLRRSHQHYVIARPEQSLRENIHCRQGSRLGMFPRSYTHYLRMVTGVHLPRFAVKLRRSGTIIVPGRNKRPGETLDQIRCKLNAFHSCSFGTSTRLLSEYVRNQHVFSMEEAVRKMTSLPANRLGLADRGILRQGMKADVVVFDPATVKDMATYENPAQYSTGIAWVLVNGKAVVADGKPTNATPGRVLRGPGYKPGTP